MSELDLPGIPIPTPPPRFFLSHAKSCDGEALEMLVHAASAILDRLSGGKPYDLVLGRAYYDARFKECGSWEAWALEVGQGIDYLTRRPTFTAIMVPAGLIGAATVKIIEAALRARRPVYTFDLSERWATVVGTRKVGSSWQNGWQMIADRAFHS
jgi:hypothetical protein